MRFSAILTLTQRFAAVESTNMSVTRTMTSIRHRKHMIALKFSFGELPFWIILVFCSIGYSFADKTTPGNQAALRGAAIHLNCSLTSFQGHPPWQAENTSDGIAHHIYAGAGVLEGYGDLFSVNQSVNGGSPLTIKKLSETTSGKYICQSNDQYGAQVIMLDAPPTCSKEMTASSVKATCIIGFSGFWPPDLEWSNAKGETITEDVNITQTNGRVISSVTLPLKTTDPSEPYNLTCTQKFTEKNKPPPVKGVKMAENIPELTYSCSVSNEPKPKDEPNPKDKSTVDPKPPKPTTTPTGAGALNGGPTTSTSSSSVSAYMYDGHNQYLHLCLDTLIFIGLLHKWLWAMTEEEKV